MDGSTSSKLQVQSQGIRLKRCQEESKSEMEEFISYGYLLFSISAIWVNHSGRRHTFHEHDLLCSQRLNYAAEGTFRPQDSSLALRLVQTVVNFAK